MAIYTFTTANWNDPDLWATVDGLGGSHTLSFVELPADFSINFDEGTGFSLSNGQQTFVVGTGSGAGSTDAGLPGGTTLADFPTILGTQGGDLIKATDGVDVLARALAMTWSSEGRAATSFPVAQAATRFMARPAATSSRAMPHGRS
jgi:hypothetical protein